MNGALVGFRVGGINKLMRLHGERSCEQILCDLLAYLRSVRSERLWSYARSLQLIDVSDGPYPSPGNRARVEAFFQDYLGESCNTPVWSDVFVVMADLEAWHAGFPFLPDAHTETCGDVSWGFLVNLDAGMLQVFINRHARFDWRDVAAQAPFCTIPLAAARKLSAQDVAALHEVLRVHFWSDGLDPVLPAREGVSAAFAGPGGWAWRIKAANNRFRLLLSRQEAEVEVALLGEMRFNHLQGGAFLRSVVDPALLRLGYAIYGPGLSLAEAARVAAHKAELPFLPGASGLPLLDLGLRQSTGFALQPGVSYFDRLRADMLAAGMSNQGWRFLVKQSGPALRCLLGYFRPSAPRLREFVQYINLLASGMQNEPLHAERCQPALRGVQRILERGPEKAGPVRQENARIYLRALMRARLDPEQQANLVHEAQQVSDFVHSRLAPLDGKNATWQSLCRRSHEWHREAWTRIAPERDVHWDALLPNWETGSFAAVELNSGAGLAEEGLEQKHCVGSYAGACASGSCRIFSLRRNGKRLATIELRREPDGHWRIGQVRGKANSIIEDQVLLGVAGQVAAAYATAAQHRTRLAVG